MPWELMLSTVPILCLAGVLVFYERMGAKREIERKKRYEDSLQPMARIANGLHKKKYGHDSPALVKEFPELKAVE